MTRPIVVAVSGQGRLLGHLLSVQMQSSFKVAAVIASTKDCGGYKLADQHGLEVFVGDFPKAQEPEDQNLTRNLLEFMKVHQPKLTVLAGFLRPFGHFIDPPAINIHPSLLPQYGGVGLYGKRVHEAVIRSQDKVSGATCHWVTKDYDAGEVICQAVVPRFTTDTAESLANRVFHVECSLLVEAINWGLNVGSLR